MNKEDFRYSYRGDSAGSGFDRIVGWQDGNPILEASGEPAPITSVALIYPGPPFCVRFQDIEIRETFNGYNVTHIPGGDTVGIGDGVDQYFYLSGDAIPPGTVDFNIELIRDLYGSYEAFTEAHFPDYA